MKFRYLCGVGRSGSHWFKEFIGFVCRRDVIAMHEGFAVRSRLAGCTTLEQWTARYVSRIENHWPGRDIYVECEGTLLDRGAMHFELPSASKVVNALPVEDVRGVLLVRHPFGYVASVKASGWLGGWWKRPFAGKLPNMVDDFDQRTIVEQASISWNARNTWFVNLVPDMAHVLRYEDVLGKDVTEKAYLERLGWLLDWFEVEPTVLCAEWTQYRHRRVHAKNPRRITLDEAEQGIVREICAPMMAELGY